MSETVKENAYRRLTVSFQKKPCYDIVFEHSFERLPEELMRLFLEVDGDNSLKKRNLCVITDRNVDALFGSEIKELLQGICKGLSFYVFSAGEEHKTLETVSDIYRFLIEKKITRKIC